MATAPCLRLTTPIPSPSIEIPQFGKLQTSRFSLYDAPDPSFSIMRMQDAAALALAPFRRFVDILDALMSVKAVLDAIPDAITSLNPQPIIDAIENVVKKLAKLATFIPPLSYLPPLLDLAAFVVSTIDNFTGLLIYIDDRLTEHTDVQNIATTLGDTVLAGYADYASTDLQVQLANSTEMLSFVSSILQILLSPLTQIMSNSLLKKMLGNLGDISTDLNAQLASLTADIGSSTFEMSAIGPIVKGVVELRNVAVQVYNIVGPLIGRDTQLEIVPTPTFTHF